MIGYYLGTLYGCDPRVRIEYMSSELWAGRIPRGLTTLDHIFTIRAPLSRRKKVNRRIYCCVVDFQKAFDIVLHASLI